MTLNLPSYTGSALKRELKFYNGYLSLLYFCLEPCKHLQHVVSIKWKFQINELSISSKNCRVIIACAIAVRSNVCIDIHMGSISLWTHIHENLFRAALRTKNSTTLTTAQHTGSNFFLIVKKEPSPILAKIIHSWYVESKNGWNFLVHHWPWLIIWKWHFLGKFCHLSTFRSGNQHETK